MAPIHDLHWPPRRKLTDVEVRFGDRLPPSGPIVAVRVEDLHEKEAVLAANPGAFITIPHFDGFAAVLILLDEVTVEALHEALVDGWLTFAPPDVAERCLRVE